MAIPKSRGEIDILCDLFTGVLDWSRTDWEKNPTDLYSSLIGRAVPLTRENVEADKQRWKKNNRIQISAKHPIYFPPSVDAQYVAFLLMDWGFAADAGPGQLRLQLVRMAVPGVKTVNQTVCLHLDGPNKKPWNYHHLQIGNRHTKGCENLYHESPEWFPQELPRVPLPGGSAYELFFCLLVGLFGASNIRIAELQKTASKDKLSLLYKSVQQLQSA